MKSFITCVFAVVLLLLNVQVAAWAQDYRVDWFTFDGGGGTSAEGDYAVSGTIGQPDAQPPPIMSAGAYVLRGGFWFTAAEICALPGDMNGDGQRDGDDVQAFITCLFGAGGTNCPCADLDSNGSVGDEDVPLFVTALVGP